MSHPNFPQPTFVAICHASGDDNEPAPIENAGTTSSEPWEVDWNRVREADQWRDTCDEYAPEEAIISRSWCQGIEICAVAPSSYHTAHAGLAVAGPHNARAIHSVFLKRCAGYAKTPRAEQALHAITNPKATSEEQWALRIYLREARTADIDHAWRTKEFTMEELMRATERYVEHTDWIATRSVRKWMKKREPRNRGRCAEITI